MQKNTDKIKKYKQKIEYIKLKFIERSMYSFLYNKYSIKIKKIFYFYSNRVYFMRFLRPVYLIV